MGMKPAGRENSDLKTCEEAAVWLQRLRIEDTPVMRAEFSAWIAKGAAHLEEFLFAQAIWKEMDHIDPAMRERLCSAETTDAVVDFPKREAVKIAASWPVGTTPRFRRPWLVSAAAILAVIAVGWLVLALFNSGANVYETELGEQQSVKLADGSIMHLNTNSRAEVKLTESERVIRLAAGEALFTVARDAQRPFYVLTDSARIRAIGTQFNVYRSSGTETRVAVVDGVVQVSSQGRAAEANPAPIQLKAGDEADVDRRRVMKKARRASIERAVSWRARRLMFQGDPVHDIVEQFNRYNRTPIRLEGETVQTRRISGVFDADDPSPLIRYLERDPKIEVIRGADEILIRPR